MPLCVLRGLYFQRDKKKIVKLLLMPGLFDLIFDDIFSIPYIVLNSVLFRSQLNTFSTSLTPKKIPLRLESPL